jgi:hypothetical protein
MQQDRDLYERVTRIRAEAFDLIAELSIGSDGDDADPMRTLALVRMQAVANSLGRIQSDLRADRDEPVRTRSPRA